MNEFSKEPLKITLRNEEFIHVIRSVNLYGEALLRGKFEAEQNRLLVIMDEQGKPLVSEWNDNGRFSVFACHKNGDTRSLLILPVPTGEIYEVTATAGK